jgi:hypothetical protein
MKEQLKLDKGAKSMLIDLGKEAELTGEIDILQKYLNSSEKKSNR